MPFRLLNIATREYLTVRDLMPELNAQTPAKFADVETADEALEDYDYSFLERGEEPPDVEVVEVDGKGKFIRYVEVV